MNRLINQLKIYEAVGRLTQRYLQVIRSLLPVCPFQTAGPSNDATRNSWTNTINQQHDAAAGKIQAASATLIIPDAANDSCRTLRNAMSVAIVRGKKVDTFTHLLHPSSAVQSQRTERIAAPRRGVASSPSAGGASHHRHRAQL